MGYWGVCSYETDAADEALDAAMERVHGELYDQLMDDRNPLSYEQVQQKLMNGATLTAALAALREALGEDLDEEGRLSYAGVVVRHAEAKVPLPSGVRRQALEWLREESLDWDEDQSRRDRQRLKEMGCLEAAAEVEAGGSAATTARPPQ